MKKALVFLLAFVLLLAGCSANSASGGSELPDELKIAAIQGPSALSLLKMWEDGEEMGGVPAVYELLASPDLVVSALAQGTYDIAFLPLNTAANLFNKGTDYRLIGASTWGNMYVIGNDGSLDSLESFSGRTISVSGRGATPDVLIRYFLNEYDLTDAVTLDYTLTAHADLAAAIAAGSVDLALMPEPFVSNVLAAREDMKILLNMQEVWAEVTGLAPLIPQTAVVVRGEFLEKYPDVVSDFIAKQKLSADYCNTNTSELAALAQKHGVTLPAAAIENGTARSNIFFRSAPDAREDIVSYLEIILAASPADIGEKLPAEAFYAEPAK